MKNKGFTLVEIIAVIVIMGILLLIVVPATSNLMRSNEEKEYVTYYEMVEAGLEKYARTRRNEVGGTKDVGCIDDKNLADMIRLGYVKTFDQEDDVFCGTPREFDQALLSSWGIDTSKAYASMRVEGDHGKITTKLSLICIKINDDGTYYEEPEYVKMIEVGPNCTTTEMYDPLDKFNILYNYEGGVAPDTGVPAFYYYGKGEKVNGVPTKSNYTFSGWDNGSSIKFEHIIQPEESGEKSFTAKWCKSCAETNGASCSLDVTSTPGTCRYITTCPDHYDISNNGAYNPSCTAQVYSIAYTGGGTLSSNGTPRNYTYGVGATINGNATKTGYTFNGWNYESVKATSHTIPTTAYGNKTVEALWCRRCNPSGLATCALNAGTPGQCRYSTSCPTYYTISNDGQYNPNCTGYLYNISYNYDGGTAPSSGVPANYRYGTGATVNGRPTKTNYTFNGWNNGSTNAFTHTIPTTATGDKSFTAKWCRNCAPGTNATCTLDADTAGTCTYVTSCPANYTISNNGQYNPTCTGDLYNISYDYAGGTPPTNGVGVPSTYRYGTGTKVNGTPTKANYTFNGWNNGSTNAYEHTISASATGNKSFTAKWCRNCAPGTSNASCTLSVTTAGTCTYTTTCPTGYIISNNGAYNPSCTASVYNIKYNYDGGTAPSSGVPTTYTYGVGATVNGTPTKTDYTFNGWNNGSTNAFSHTIPTTATGEKSFTAKWCRNCAATNGASCTLTATTAGTCTYTTTCPTGYTISNNGQYNPSCTANVYNISYSYDGGTAPSDTTGVPANYTYGVGATINGLPTRTGYNFVGWSNGTQTLYPQSVASTATGDKSFTAVWKICDGWLGSGTSWNYYSNGEPIKGNDGIDRYIDRKGTVLKGQWFKTVPDNFSATCNIGSKPEEWYYLVAANGETAGVTHTGWLKSGDYWYFFEPGDTDWNNYPDCNMIHGIVRKVDTYYYSFDTEGRCTGCSTSSEGPFGSGYTCACD